MSRASSRLYATGGILFVVDGIMHCIGQFTLGPPDPTGQVVEKAMRGYAIPGTSFTYWNIMQCWGALFGAMTILFGVLLLACARSAASEPRLRRATALVGVLAAVVQSVVSIVYGTPPPAFFMVPAALILALAAGMPERRTS